MAFDQIVFAGVDLSSGRKPVTFTALDADLKILALHRLSMAESISCLNEYEHILLGINTVSQKAAEFKKVAAQAGLKQISRPGPQQWLETDARQCFLTFCEHKLLSRRSIEGRIQRALILSRERLQLPDPMDYFEEITPHRLLQGILPVESLPAVRELDALVAAYVAWMYVNEPRQITVVGNRALPSRESEE